ncbi:MAG: MarR family winged helix-turn-helix transcriptional regulator [Nitrosopumilus sp.]|nr:MarR family winged helix-turn-helix transcriptional regulator [Nitrosopumilus sp.]MDH3502566.1 MarR family winged helix-turn-helix transcriptional regulator [Nitrosopumilus sp.]
MNSAHKIKPCHICGKTLSNTIKMLTLARSENRFSLIKDDKQFLISSKSDVTEAIQMIREPNPIAATKIQFFNEKIRLFFIGRLDSTIAREIAEYLEMDRKKLVETYLAPFVDHGYLEKEKDQSNTSRDVYSITPRFEKDLGNGFQGVGTSKGHVRHI